MTKQPRATNSTPAVDMGNFVCSGRVPNVVPPFVWYVLSILALSVGVPLILSSVSLLNASQPDQRYGGQVALGLGAILVLISALTGYSGISCPHVYKIHFYTNGLIAYGGPNRGAWLYADIRKLSVHIIHPGRRLSLMAIVHVLMLLAGCVLLVFRNGQRVATSYDYLFGGGHTMVALRDTEHEFHVLRYSRLQTLGTIISNRLGESTVSSQVA